MTFKIIYLTGVFFLVLPAFVRAQTVTGTNFELRSSSGRMTAQLTTAAEGTPALFFYDANHVARISIGLYPDGAPGVVLNDDTGKAAAIVRLVESNGNPVVVLKENGQDKLVIDTKGMPSGSPSSLLLTIIFGCIAGMFGGFGAVLLLKKNEHLSV